MANRLTEAIPDEERGPSLANEEVAINVGHLCQ
ncbi:hypothetical protein T03_6508, partial [Trichinella britovi]